MGDGMQRLLIIFSVLFLASCGGGGGGSTPAPAPNPGSGGGNANTPPSFSSATSFSFNENEFVEFTLTVSDPDSGDTVTITDDTSGDGALFTVDVNTGRVIANTASGGFDFENPQDTNGDNVYEQDITLSDGTATITETISISIANVDEGPVFTSPPILDLNENVAGVVYTFTAEDPEGVGTVSDYRIFEVTKLGEVVNSDRLLAAFSINEQSGELTVNTAFDAEVEGTQNPFVISVEASDGTVTTVGALTINLIDIPARVTSGLRFTGTENSKVLGTYSSKVGDIDGDGLEEVWITQEIIEQDNPVLETAYLVWGSTIQAELAGGVADFNIDDLTADQVVIFTNDDPALETRRSSLEAISADDIDGDGVIDLLIQFKETRELNAVEDIADGPLAAVIWGSTINSISTGSFDLSALGTDEGVFLTGLTRQDNINTSAVAADVDGDGRSDIVIGTPFRNEVKIIYGSSIANSTGVFNIFDALLDPNLMLTVRSETPGSAIIQGIGMHVTSIADLDTDGHPELVISGDGLEPVFNEGVYILSSQAISAAKGTDFNLNLLDPAISENVVEMLGGDDSRIIGLSTSGDVDGDGLDDLAIAHNGNFAQNKTATLVYGSTIQSSLPGSESASLLFTDPGLGVNINVNDQIFTQNTDARVRVSLVPNLTENGGADLLIGLPDDSPLGREMAGSVTVISKASFEFATTALIEYSNDDFPPALGRKFLGPLAGAQIGAHAFAEDLNGDTNIDLAMASPTAGVDTVFGNTGAFLILHGNDFIGAFGDTSGSFDMAMTLNNESP